MDRIFCFKPTTDDWYPCYRIKDDARHTGGFVHVMVMELGPDATSGYRVSVWGADDCGMEKDFLSYQVYEALGLYGKVVLLENVNKADLEALGFVRA